MCQINTIDSIDQLWCITANIDDIFFQKSGEKKRKKVVASSISFNDSFSSDEEEEEDEDLAEDDSIEEGVEAKDSLDNNSKQAVTQTPAMATAPAPVQHCE